MPITKEERPMNRLFSFFAVGALVVGCATAAPSPAVVVAPVPTPGALLEGSWQVRLTATELIAAGASADGAHSAVYTWTFEEGRAMIEVRPEGDAAMACVADMAATGEHVRLSYEGGGPCGGEVDTIRWALESDGLHLSLVETNAGFEANKAYLEAKPWQSVDTRPIPTAAPWQSRCEPGCQGPITPGTFTSVGFLPGLQMTFADETWFNTADNSDEIEFDATSSSNALRLWRTARASSETGGALLDVSGTPAALTAWFVGNVDMVVSDPKVVTIGGGISATTFSLQISDTYVNVDPGCPSDVRSCLNVLWINDGHVFAIGYGEAVRLYLFTVGSSSEAQTVVISLDAHDDRKLATMTTDVAPILESIRFLGP